MAKEFYTLHELMAILTKDLSLTPEQQFRVTAKIKRLVHIEKHNLYSRYAEYADGRRIFEEGNEVGRDKPQDVFLWRILTESRDNHERWMNLPDEEIVTWDVGTHKFEQKRPPCSSCGDTLSASVGWFSICKSDHEFNYCKPCAIKSGVCREDDWEKE